tara:strand:+ start:1144 stop:1323 length:180 start_codon:yes stop_codon:yes gene_type:complete
VNWFCCFNWCLYGALIVRIAIQREFPPEQSDVNMLLWRLGHFRRPGIVVVGVVMSVMMV